MSGATLAVVMDKYEWNFDESDNSENDLACGELKRQAEKSAAFPDGSVLFRLYPPPKKRPLLSLSSAFYCCFYLKDF